MAVGDALTQGDGARGAGRRELHETNVVVDSLIDVGDEPDLVGVEGLGPIDIGNGHGDEFQLPVHGGFAFWLAARPIVRVESGHPLTGLRLFVEAIPSATAANSGETGALAPVFTQHSCAAGGQSRQVGSSVP